MSICDTVIANFAQIRLVFFYAVILLLIGPPGPVEWLGNERSIHGLNGKMNRTQFAEIHHYCKIKNRFLL